MEIFRRKAQVGDWIKIKKCKIPNIVGRCYMVVNITRPDKFKELYHIDDKFHFKRNEFKLIK